MFGSGKKVAELEQKCARLSALVGVLSAGNDAMKSNLFTAKDQMDALKIALEESEKKKVYAEQDNTRLKRRVAELSAAADASKRSGRSVEDVLEKLSEDILQRIVGDVTVYNFESSKRQIEKLFNYCKQAFATFDDGALSRWKSVLRVAQSEAQRKDLMRQKQAEAREQMRDDARAAKERERELARVLREEEVIRRELAELRLRQQGEENAKRIAELLAQLDAAQAQTLRTQAQAELTRAGHVYVISNIGSFGDGVFKVGLTRRLNEYDRISELSNASVPFPYDVHMMIWSEDAPKLEANLHQLLHRNRLNKINGRKEFFHADLEMLKRHVEENHGPIKFFQIEATASQYHESRLIEERGEDVEFDMDGLQDDDSDDLDRVDEAS